MGRRRPPDILRKSHAHTEGKARARARQQLRESLDVTLTADERALLIDLDGVVFHGDEVIAGAAEAIAWLAAEQVRHLFVTNTTSRPREALVEKLDGFGIPVDVDDIQAPPDAAAAWLAAHGVNRLLLAVPAATARAFAGFDTLTLDEAIDRQRDRGREAAPAIVDAVVVGDIGAGWSFERLNAAFRCLMQAPQPKLIALGMTRYWHAPEGLRLDTAPFVTALAHASGAEPVVLGKPSPEFFAAALERLGVPAARSWMIGDDIRTDVAGAQAAGLKAILVRTGKFRPADLALGIEPELTIDSVADLPRAWTEHA
ncbi:MAG TPA: TIGR01458 family HAD-type hydrolase [Gammaproteobacteria bacterium]|jgi:HAD superfamily hydrolase (TIGR01458 family)